MERSTSDCLTILGLDPPKITGKSQDEVDTKLSEWKEGPLKAAYHAKAHEFHPDKPTGDADAFRAAKEAYEQLLDLRVNLKRSEKKCPNGHDRIPEGAKYCHECGYCYTEDPLVARLKAAGITEQTIAYLRTTGEFDRLKALSPLSPELRQQMTLLFHRQRLGLIGPHSGWR